MKKFVLILLAGLYSPVSSADISGYDYSPKRSFWTRLYVNGGWTLYCGYHFSDVRKTTDGKTIEVEHILPISTMVERARCDSRMRCHEAKNELFQKMESDLHNMYPVWQEIITLRHGYEFGELASNEKRFTDCDIEWKAGTLEPRPIARGNIARSLLYMYNQYGIKIKRQYLNMLLLWNSSDLPSKQETARNNIIEIIQGNRNPFIDDPGIARKTRFKTY